MRVGIEGMLVHKEYHLVRMVHFYAVETNFHATNGLGENSMWDEQNIQILCLSKAELGRGMDEFWKEGQEKVTMK